MATADGPQRCGWCEGPLVRDAGRVRCLGGCPYQPDEVPARVVDRQPERRQAPRQS